ncbi:MAG: hypothetical protein JJT82_06240 [Legionellaceae bacterium]|nr:hypothetical protein [Legionellaceae bacterium]
MNVKAIQDFLDRIQSTILDFEVTLVTEMQAHFQKRDAQEALSSNDFLFLRDIFAQRFIAIENSDYDYSLAHPAKNGLWTSLAREIAADQGRSLLETLIPQITNTQDALSFTQARQIVDLRHILLFRYEKQLLWQDIRAFSANSSIPPSLSLIKGKMNPRTVPYRALRLAELRQIARKDRSALCTTERSGDDDLWQSIVAQYRSDQSGKPALAHRILTALLHIAELAVEQNTTLQSAVTELDKLLDQHAEQRRILYRLRALLEGRYYDMVDLLCNKIYHPEDHSLAARALAAYVYQHNKCLQSAHPLLRSAYPPLNTRHLIQYIDALQPAFNIENTAKKGLLAVKAELLRDLKTLEEELPDQRNMELMMLLFSEHWRLTRKDFVNYTNAPVLHAWCELACSLARTGWIEENWFRFLMPDIEVDTTFQPCPLSQIQRIPVTDFIIDDRNQFLLYIPDLLHYRQQHHQFMIKTKEGSRKMTPNEHLRLKLAVAEHSERYKVLNRPITIMFSTLLALQELTCSILIPLLCNSKKPMDLEAASKAARLRFVALRKQLDDKERANLDHQVLRWGGSVCYFSTWLERLDQPKANILEQAHLLLQLLVDYHPILYFHPAIEKKYNMEYKREQSRKHMVQDETAAGEEKIAKRLKQLFLAMLVPPFSLGQWVDDAKTITVWDKVYSVPQKLYSLYMTFEHKLKDYPCSSLQWTFFELERCLHVAPSYPFGLSIWYAFISDGHNKICNWLDNFRDGAIYDQQRNPWYSLPVLLQGLYQYQKTPTSLLDEAFHTLCQQQYGVALSTIELRVNLLFREYWSRLAPSEQSAFCTHLERVAAKPATATLTHWLKNHVTDRLCQLSLDSQRSPTFFQNASDPKSNPIVSEHRNLIKKQLAEVWENYKPHRGCIAEAIRSQLQSCGLLSRALKDYLQTLGSKINPAEETTHPSMATSSMSGT